MSTALEFLEQAHEKGVAGFPRRVQFEREIVRQHESAKNRYRLFVECASPDSANGLTVLGEYSCLNLVIQSLARAWGWDG